MGGVIAAGVIAAWSIPDWVSVVGLPLALIGLGLGWRQLAQTKDAAEAAREAVQETERHLAKNHLLLLIPRMVQFERDVQHAVETNQRDAARDHLTAWRQTAVQVRTIVRREQGRGELTTRLDKGITLVEAAQDSLRDHTRDALDATRHVRQASTEAGDSALEIVTERMYAVERTTRDG